MVPEFGAAAPMAHGLSPHSCTDDASYSIGAGTDVIRPPPAPRAPSAVVTSADRHDGSAR
ncbi:hypothetical protein SAMN05444374_102104 [Rhodococcoides kroppenstedtii]|uniref:Uncharacterized protein n=1 Tax=Rhodococcoides kroppenstedtii TaxID=293050 RepID=A0A1I0SQF1_9NOCA|nr:hypothetical protein SAMN05444374_102104 [Rhodococcus kroppenstedtii]